MLLKLVVAIVIMHAVDVGAIVCPENICDKVNCPDLSGCNGDVVEKSSYCGCCSTCVQSLGEGDYCGLSFILGVPSKKQCGSGLVCDSKSGKCKKTAAGSCTKLLNAQSGGLLGAPKPRCDKDGSFCPVQCKGSVCGCVDAFGNEIKGFSSAIGDSQYQNCKCARDSNNYQKTGMIGKIFNCETNGNYKAYKCEGSVCFCVDEQGKQLSGPSVAIGNMNQLNCIV